MIFLEFFEVVMDCLQVCCDLQVRILEFFGLKRLFFFETGRFDHGFCEQISNFWILVRKSPYFLKKIENIRFENMRKIFFLSRVVSNRKVPARTFQIHSFSFQYKFVRRTDWLLLVRKKYLKTFFLGEKWCKMQKLLKFGAMKQPEDKYEHSLCFSL